MFPAGEGSAHFGSKCVSKGCIYTRQTGEGGLPCVYGRGLLLSSLLGRDYDPHNLPFAALKSPLATVHDESHLDEIRQRLSNRRIAHLNAVVRRPGSDPLVLLPQWLSPLVARLNHQRNRNLLPNPDYSSERLVQVPFGQGGRHTHRTFPQGSRRSASASISASVEGPIRRDHRCRSTLL
jgi:hypothetical protein